MLYQSVRACLWGKLQKAHGCRRCVVWRLSGTDAAYRIFPWKFFADMITKYAHWIAFVLLIIIGGNMLKEAMGEDEKVDACMDAKEMFLLAIATSIDALAVGVTFAFLKVQIVPAVSFIGCVTFVCSAIGVKIGSIFGSKYRSKAEFCGGVILILIGLKILLNGLGIM